MASELVPGEWPRGGEVVNVEKFVEADTFRNLGGGYGLLAAIVMGQDEQEAGQLPNGRVRRGELGRSAVKDGV